MADEWKKMVKKRTCGDTDASPFYRTAFEYNEIVS